MTEYMLTNSDKAVVDRYAKWLYMWLSTDREEREMMGLRPSDEIKADEEYVQTVTVNVLGSMSWADAPLPELPGYMQKFSEQVHQKIDEFEADKNENGKSLNDLFAEYAPVNSLEPYLATTSSRTPTDNSNIQNPQIGPTDMELRQVMGYTDIRDVPEIVDISAQHMVDGTDINRLADVDDIILSLTNTSITKKIRRTSRKLRLVGRKTHKGAKVPTPNRAGCLLC